jgi:hypothetical protein
LLEFLGNTMKRRSLFALVGLMGLGSAALSCGSDKPPKCVYRDAKPLTENAATKILDAKLISVGKDFVVAGIDGMTASWAPLTAAGIVGAASTLTLTETPVIPPQLAVTSRTTPGDQLVVVYGIMNAQMQIELRAVTQFAGEAAAAPISVKVLPAGLALADVRVTVGSSRTGQKALVAWGLAEQPGTKIETILLGANGALAGAPISFDAPDSWKCLQFVPSRSDWGLSWVRLPSTGNPWFVVEEGRDSNFSLARFNVSLSTAVEVGCPSVVTSDRGYLIAWQTLKGTWVTDYNIAAGAVNPNFVAGAVRFGDQANQPPIAGLTAMGLDTSVTFGVKSGPQVWLFNAFGALIGDALKLPAPKGNVGPVSTYSTTSAFFATYREGTAAVPDEGPRWFMKVECPSN